MELLSLTKTPSSACRWPRVREILREILRSQRRSVVNGAKISRVWDGLMPRRGRATEPRVSIPSFIHNPIGEGSARKPGDRY